jgi:hypothetical protein
MSIWSNPHLHKLVLFLRGTSSGTGGGFELKKGFIPILDKPLMLLVPRAGVEPARII